MSEWRDIGSVPKTGGGRVLGRSVGPFVLLSDGGEIPTVGFWNGRFFDDGDFNSTMDDFTHWMPLPAPPAQAKKDEQAK